MSAQASMQCGAGYGERSEERENSRNGYRLPALGHPGRLDRAGRARSCARASTRPEFLLQPRRRAEQALVAVICQAYVEGVSTRRVDDLVKAMGIDGISSSEVSRMAAELDAKVVSEFRERPLDAGPYRYLWIDALTQRVREGGPGGERLGRDRHRRQRRGPARDRRLRHRHHRGHRRLDRVPARAWWPGGSSGVELVISDAHGGIKAAIATVLRRGHLAAVPDPLHGQPGLPGAPRATGR